MTTGDKVLDATNEIIAEVDRQLKTGGLHLTQLAVKIVRIIEKHNAVKREFQMQLPALERIDVGDAR